MSLFGVFSGTLVALLLVLGFAVVNAVFNKVARAAHPVSTIPATSIDTEFIKSVEYREEKANSESQIDAHKSSESAIQPHSLDINSAKPESSTANTAQPSKKTNPESSKVATQSQSDIAPSHESIYISKAEHDQVKRSFMARIQELRDELLVRDQEKAEMGATIRQAEEDAHDNLAEIGGMSRQLEEKEDEVDEMRVQIRQLLKEKEGEMAESIRKVRRLLNDEEGKVAELNAEIRQLLEHKEGETAELNGEIDQLRKDKADAKELISELQASLMDKGKLVFELRAQLTRPTRETPPTQMSRLRFRTQGQPMPYISPNRRS